MDDEHAAAVHGLQQTLREERATLAKVAPGTPGYDSAVAAVLKATDAVVEFEDRIPDLVEEARRRVSSRITRGLYGAAAVVVLGLGVVAVVGFRSRWWLLLVVPLLLWMGAATLGESSAPLRGHRERCVSAGVALLVGVVLAVVVAGWLSLWWLVAVVLGLFAGFGLWLHADERERGGRG